MAPIQYIVIKQGVAAAKVPSISAHAAITAYVHWHGENETQAFADSLSEQESRKLRVVVANPTMFARLKETFQTYVLTDGQANNEEVALVPKIEEDYPDDFINLPNWYVNA